MRSAAPGVASKSSLRYVVRISVDSRLWANTISCRLRFRNSDAIRRVSLRYDRRIDEDEKLFTAGRAALFHELERLLGESFGELARVGDRGRRAQEYRIRAVMM